jgi:hypothetical protein
MNKHIKQFERESGLDVYSLGLDKTKWESKLEKFAKLIVNECSGIAHGSDMPSKDIKEHFGVEE